MRTARGRYVTAGIGIVAGILIAAGITVLAIGLSNHLDRIGALLVIMGGQVAVTAYFSGKRGTLDDAYEAGYQAGYHRGERARPKVLYLPIERRQVPASRLWQEQD